MNPSSNHVYGAPYKKLKAIESQADFISSLPESVITHILSRIPTKDAVKTSILSRNWKYKWTCIYSIDFDDDYECKFEHEKERNTNFNRFVHKSARNTSFSRFVSQTLMRGHLSSNETYCSDQIENWILAVLKRNVQDLSLDTRFQHILSAHCFSGWTSLTELKLRCASCTLDVSASTCFSNLKSLYLIGETCGIKIKNDQSPNTKRVLWTFPVLEVLELNNCKWLDIEYVEIWAPELLRLRICSTWIPSDWEIKVCAPKLRKYESMTGLIDKLVVIAPAVTHAYLYHDMSDILASRASMILKGFRNLKCLKLGCETVEALVQSKLLIVFNALVHLKRLELDCPCSRDILELLRALPSLESLDIEIWDLEKEYRETLELSIMPHLKDVKFTKFGGTRCELDLANAILKSARNLQRVFVSLTTEKEKTEINRQFSKLLPSLNCVLQVEKAIEYNVYTEWYTSEDIN